MTKSNSETCFRKHHQEVARAFTSPMNFFQYSVLFLTSFGL